MTQRLFRLKGNVKDSPATGSVTISGSGVFRGPFSQGSTDESDGFLCEFAYEVDDLAGTVIQLPVVITVDTGTVGVGMFQYNYDSVSNPALTQEQLEYFTTNTKADASAEMIADVRNKGGLMIHDATAFDYGLTKDKSHCNRTMVTINGSLLSEELNRTYIHLPAGSVCTFTTILFSSVVPPEIV